MSRKTLDALRRAEENLWSAIDRMWDAVGLMPDKTTMSDKTAVSTKTSVTDTDNAPGPFIRSDAEEEAVPEPSPSRPWNTYLIIYRPDARTPVETIRAFDMKLQSLQNFQETFPRTWFIQTRYTAYELFQLLSHHLYKHDLIHIISVDFDDSYGILPNAHWTWLNVLRAAAAEKTAKDQLQATAERKTLRREIEQEAAKEQARLTEEMVALRRRAEKAEAEAQTLREVLLAGRSSDVTFASYQEDALRTYNGDKPRDELLVWYAMGLAGETGEVVDLLKKIIYHHHDFNRDALLKECGDVLWYMTALAKTMGADLIDVARANIEKRAKRYPDGWDIEKSKTKDDEK
jgi:NTP pyrophosphatase (non-canonical NTP hydrolase)